AVQHGGAVFCGELRGRAELQRGQRVVVDEARAAHQGAVAEVVDRAVVLDVVEEAAGRIDRARMVERHGVGDVPAQAGGRTEIGQRREGEDGAHACRTQAWDA